MPGRLYLKIFFSFICVMVVVMFLVAGLFRHTQGRRFLDQFRQLARAQVTMVRTVVEDNARLNKGAVEPLQALVDKLAEAYLARIWITDARGDVVVQSFAGPIPTPLPEDPDDGDDADKWASWTSQTGATVFRCDDDPHCLSVTIPFGGGDGVEPGTIHYLYQGLVEQHHEERFFIGLLAIGLVMAVLIMPVSWIITRRLKRLRGSALRIANGDLAHRARIKGRDEVAGVGEAINRMAASLSRMITASRELTANVSHELRTPLTRMRIAEEMLREQSGERRIPHLDSIRQDIEALDRLIGRTLTLSKLDLKEDCLSLEPVNLADLVRAAMDRLTPIAEHRKVTVTERIEEEVVVLADGEGLLSGLSNILENGVRHATAGGRLSVNLLADNGAAVLTTENTCPPLPEEELTAIFEPFRRAKGTRTQGTGLGLAIARRLVLLHNGTIRAENTPGGIRFTVTLPISSD